MSTFRELSEHVSFLSMMELPSRDNYGTTDLLLLEVGPDVVRLVEAVGADLKRRGYPAGAVLDAYLKLVPCKLDRTT
jgi:hypothetical protein